MHISKREITHVFVIKDESGLEEESHTRTTITVAAAAAIAAATISLSIFSVDGSVYFTFVKNKENLNMTRRRKRIKDRLSFCTYIFCLAVHLLAERDDCCVVVFFSLFFFFVSREMNVPMQKRYFSSSFLSFVRSRPKKERERGKKKEAKCRLSLVFIMSILRAFVCC